MTNQAINAAIETAKAKSANNAAWSRSVEKAAAGLLNGELLVTVLVDGGLVSSPRGCYRIKNGRCCCKGAACGHCYHLSALRIVALADELETAPAVARRRPSRVVRSIERDVITHRAITVYTVDGWAI